MSTPSRRQVVVVHLQHPVNRKQLLWAGLAAVISIAAHALLVFLLLNVNVNPAGAQAGEEGTVQPLPLVDDDPPKKEKPAPLKENNRRQGEKIDLTLRVVGDPEKEIVPEPLDPIDPPEIPFPPVQPPVELPDPGSLGGLAPLPNLEGPGLTGLPGTGETKPRDLSGRLPSAKPRMLETGGGSKESEARVARGLIFLANHQAKDGHWSMHEFNKDAHKTVMEKSGAKTIYAVDKSTPDITIRRDDVAGTAFGLLPFLGAGHTHLPVPGAAIDYHKNVKAGLDWLMRSQAQHRDGNFGGETMYSHSLACIALCEAYGLTADPVLKRSAQLALNFIENAQNVGGGWRYKPKMAGDLSVTGWMVMALKSGQMAGLTVNPAVLKKAEKFLDSCESAAGGSSYYAPAQGERMSMTAVGLLCRQYLGVTARNEGLLKGIAKLEQHPPDPRMDIYYVYYATQVMHHIGGKSWEKWNLGPKGDGKDGVRDILIGLQDAGKKNPDNAGSWLFNGHANGRLMSTSLALLTLEVYYRHLPLYRRDVGQVKNPK